MDRRPGTSASKLYSHHTKGNVVSKQWFWYLQPSDMENLRPQSSLKTLKVYLIHNIGNCIGADNKYKYDDPTFASILHSLLVSREHGHWVAAVMCVEGTRLQRLSKHVEAEL